MLHYKNSHLLLIHPAFSPYAYIKKLMPQQLALLRHYIIYTIFDTLF
jgi:hypothetical protein